MLESQALRDTAVEQMLTMIQRERYVASFDSVRFHDSLVCRDDEMIDRDLLHVSTTIFSKLDLYNQYFFPAFLQETRAYYQAESTRLLKEMDVPEYLRHVSRRIEQESVDRLQAYLEKTSRSPLTQLVIDQLVRKPLHPILQQGMIQEMEEALVLTIYVYGRIQQDDG